ncbi:hypothetical protein SDC9_151188 [bioreactor metagenome]|uniref:Uncharacterized protein n=1 Tax=bioreactor metagenome TaxID=1076179 RepID=A0A645ETW1_9ZZZZ
MEDVFFLYPGVDTGEQEVEKGVGHQCDDQHQAKGKEEGFREQLKFFHSGTSNL